MTGRLFHRFFLLAFYPSVAAFHFVDGRMDLFAFPPASFSRLFQGFFVSMFLL